MISRKEYAKTWRSRTKKRMVDAMGGGCQRCEYNKHHEVLDFHHIDPTTKSFGLGGARANHLSWDKMVIEMRKCILLCANCHREIHHVYNGATDLTSPFIESFAVYKTETKHDVSRICPVCKIDKVFDGITCSLQCAGKRSRKVDWDIIDVVALREEGMSWVEIGDMVGCSEAAVRKRYNKVMKHN